MVGKADKNNPLVVGRIDSPPSFPAVLQSADATLVYCFSNPPLAIALTFFRRTLPSTIKLPISEELAE
jgi:hypothetical protein